METFYRWWMAIFALTFISFAGFCQQSGVIRADRTAPQGIVSFSQSTKLTGINDTRHVDGYVEKSGSGLFLFPVGHKGKYRPFAAESDGVTGAYFQENPASATLPSGGPFDTGNKESTLKNVSAIEFWDVNGVNSSRLTLTWNATSNIGNLTGNSLSLLTIAGWNATTLKWEAIGSAADELSYQGGTSSITAGSITTIQNIIPNKYSVYTLAALISPVVAANYEGSLETASCSEVRGWVWNKNYPEASLTVELFEGNTIYATGKAEINRVDLKTNGIGSGKYGFSIPTPSGLIDGKTHQLSVRVKGSNFLLAGSPKALNCGMNGSFEAANCYALTGWVWDKNNPDNTLTVALKEGNVTHTTTLADIYRQDLLNSGIGNGKYGFKIPVPQILRDGKEHQLAIALKDYEYTLPGSIRSINCPVSRYAGRMESADCNYIIGWAWDSSYPNGDALTVEVYEGNTVYATGTANIYRETLKTSGIGTGIYVFKIPTPASVMDGKEHQLSVRVKGTDVTLLDSPKTLACSPNQYTGRFEWMNCNTIEGWAWDKNSPNGPAVVVELLEGSTVHATASANGYREDLKNSGTGTGNYGFKIPMPLALRDGKAHQLSIRVKGTSIILPGTPTVKEITCQVNNYTGRFESADCNYIQGWAWDSYNPNSAALTVEIYEGSTVYATGLANIYRESLKTSGYGTGNYVFKIPTPAGLMDGKAHQLSVRVKGSSSVIPDSPRSVTCASSQFTGRFEWMNCSTIEGWAWDKNSPNGPAVVVELLEGSTVHATASANGYREDLKNSGTGTGNYGFKIPMPSALRDGKAHQLSIRVKGTSIILPGTPTVKEITCQVNNYTGRFESADCNYIQGWAWDSYNPNSAALTVEIYEGSTVYATGLANIYRESLKTSGYGTGNYVFKIPTPAGLMDGEAHQLSVRVKGSSSVIPDSPRSVTCASSQFTGRFEWMNCNTIEGWAWDKNSPNGPAVVVELLEGSTVHATASANGYREDLKNSGTGTGNYGFKIPMPLALRDGKAHQLSIRVKGTSIILPGTPTVKEITCQVNNYTGRFESADCNYIQGWAWDSYNPNSAALTVEIYEGSTVYATGLANIYRESLKTSGYGTGNYVFKIPTPAGLMDGKAHQLSVRVKGSSSVIPDSPRSVTCASSQFTGRFEWMNCSTIEGWAWDKNSPNGPAVVVELLEGSTVHATASANGYREDLKNSGTGTGNYGFKIPMPSALRDGKAHQLSIRVKGTSIILPGTPTVKEITCQVNNYTGRFESANCSYIQGWAWDSYNPNSAALTVEIYEGSTVYATGLANIYRENLKTGGYGTGNYVFKIPTPASLKDGKAHQLSIRVKGSNILLPDSPKAFTCAPTARMTTSEEGIDDSANVEINTGEQASLDLVVAPNPTNGRITASFGLADTKNAVLCVTNMLGRVVWEHKVSGQIQTFNQVIDLTGQVNGIYLVTLKTSKKTIVKRVLLVK